MSDNEESLLRVQRPLTALNVLQLKLQDSGLSSVVLFRQHADDFLRQYHQPFRIFFDSALVA